MWYNRILEIKKTLAFLTLEKRKKTTQLAFKPSKIIKRFKDTPDVDKSNKIESNKSQSSPQPHDGTSGDR